MVYQMMVADIRLQFLIENKNSPRFLGDLLFIIG